MALVNCSLFCEFWTELWFWCGSIADKSIFLVSSTLFSFLISIWRSKFFFSNFNIYKVFLRHFPQICSSEFNSDLLPIFFLLFNKDVILLLFNVNYRAVPSVFLFNDCLRLWYKDLWWFFVSIFSSVFYSPDFLYFW